MTQVLLFLSYALKNFAGDLLPVAGMLVVLVFTIIAALRQKNFPGYVRLLGVVGISLLTLSIAMEIMQPIVQLYLEEELNIIFLEANKFTGTMRNLSYLFYPGGMFALGFALFDDRFEEGWNKNE